MPKLSQDQQNWERSFFEPVAQHEYDRVLEKSGRRVAEDSKRMRLGTSTHFWRRYLGLQPSQGNLGGEIVIEPLPELVHARETVLAAVEDFLADGTEVPVERLAEMYRGIGAKLIQDPNLAILEFEFEHIAGNMRAIIERDIAALKAKAGVSSD